MPDNLDRPNPVAAGGGEVYDLCVIGAGIAGLNALFVAKQYFGDGARTALVDRNARCGGMWNSVYDYVRLHQPYQLFTVGDISWELKKPRHYLATGAEVRDHFQHCLDDIRRGISLDEYWESEATIDREDAGKDRQFVDVRVRSAGGEDTTIRSKQVIDARGLDVPVIPPLELSSRAVASIAPQHFSAALGAADTRPIYVIGGGKTGMDTAHAALSANPDRKVVLIAGRGTAFHNRDIFFPTGLRRLFGRQSNFTAAIDVVMQFDGTNATEVFDYFKRTYAISPGDEADNFFFGLLSEDESALIREHLNATVFDYLTDVVDTDAGPAIQLRAGDAIPIEAGAIVVNCTGYLTRRQTPMKPLLSSDGRVLSITPRAAFHALPGISAYFATHLMFSNQLHDAAFYVIDNETLVAADSKTWHMAALAQTVYNTIYAFEALPMKAFQEFGLDFERWQPFHKRLISFADLLRNKERYKAHCRAALEKVSAKHGAACQPFRRGAA